jgi:hypothetical protein
MRSMHRRQFSENSLQFGLRYRSSLHHFAAAMRACKHLMRFPWQIKASPPSPPAPPPTVAPLWTLLSRRNTGQGPTGTWHSVHLSRSFSHISKTIRPVSGDEACFKVFSYQATRRICCSGCRCVLYLFDKSSCTYFLYYSTRAYGVDRGSKLKAL